MGIAIWFPQALWVQQYVEPAASSVPPVVGDFHILEARGIDILFHRTEVEQHGGLQVVEEHTLSLVQGVIPLGWYNKCSPVAVHKQGFPGRVHLFPLLGPDEYKCVYGQEQAADTHSQKGVFHIFNN